MKLVPLNAEDKRDAELAQKMHFWVYAVATRANKGVAQATSNESMFVRDGKASVRVELDPRDEVSADKLKQAGLEIASNNKFTVTGKIALEKLAHLAEVKQVIYIAPRF